MPALAAGGATASRNPSCQQMRRARRFQDRDSSETFATNHACSVYLVVLENCDRKKPYGPIFYATIFYATINPAGLTCLRDFHFDLYPFDFCLCASRKAQAHAR